MKALRMLLKTGNGLSTNCCSNLSGLGRTHGRRSTVDVFKRVSYKQSAPYSTEQSAVTAARIPRSAQRAATAAVASTTAATAAATAERGASKKILLIDGHNLASRVQFGLVLNPT
jgi:hypothetical protein